MLRIDKQDKSTNQLPTDGLGDGNNLEAVIWKIVQTPHYRE